MATERIPLEDGAELAVTVEGSGPDLMLVSGLGGTAGFWSPAVAELANAFRVVRFDQRGIGGSTRGEAECSIDRLARDCLAIADALELRRPTFVGHSTGGAIGQVVARLAPDRLGGLILSATWLRPSRYMSALFGSRRRILDIDPSAYAEMGAILGYAPAWLEANWQTFEAATAKPPRSEAERRVVRERIDALLSFDGSRHASSLEQAVLVVGARDDAIVPAFLQEELAAALRQAELAVLPDGGHFFPVTRTRDFVQVVTSFVAGLW